MPNRCRKHSIWRRKITLKEGTWSWQENWVIRMTYQAVTSGKRSEILLISATYVIVKYILSSCGRLQWALLTVISSTLHSSRSSNLLTTFAKTELLICKNRKLARSTQSFSKIDPNFGTAKRSTTSRKFTLTIATTRSHNSQTMVNHPRQKQRLQSLPLQRHLTLWTLCPMFWRLLMIRRSLTWERKSRSLMFPKSTRSVVI